MKLATHEELTRTNIEVATAWFFNGGYKGMDKLDQVEYLIDFCGYTEAGAWGLVYGCADK